MAYQSSVVRPLWIGRRTGPQSDGGVEISESQ